MNISKDQIKELRTRTRAGVIDCKRALEEANGDMELAAGILRQKGLELVEKRAGRETGEGVVHAYVHNGAKLGVLIEVGCETDFVARNEEFKEFVHELAMQVAATDPSDVEELLAQEYIRDTSRTIKGLLTETVAKVGENVEVRRFIRYEVGK